MPAVLLLVESQLLVQAALLRLLDKEPTLQCLPPVQTIEQALIVLSNQKFDLLILSTPTLKIFLESLYRLQGVNVLLITKHATPMLVNQAFKQGLRGYLTPNNTENTLKLAIQTVLGGKRYLDPSLATTLALNQICMVDDPFRSLSERETQVCDLLVQGHSIDTIAKQLKISPKTVLSHRTRLQEKLKVRNEVQLLLLAESTGRFKITAAEH